MHYVVYGDLILLINTVMSFYGMALAGESLGIHKRFGPLFVVAFLGSFLHMVLLCLLRGRTLGIFLSGLLELLFLSIVAFRPRSPEGVLKIGERLLLAEGLLGSCMFLLQRLMGSPGILRGTIGMIGLGSIFYGIIRVWRRKTRRELEQNVYSVILKRGKRSVEVKALLDTGNGLWEPISQKPVNVIDERVFDLLWGEEEEGFRVIPYQCIDMPAGYMKGYRLPVMQLRKNGFTFTFREVYVAVSNRWIRSKEEQIQCILNPKLMETKCWKGE